MTADPTAPDRVARYAARMHGRGMKHVRVWVPTEADAEQIKRLAAEMRDAAVHKGSVPA